MTAESLDPPAMSRKLAAEVLGTFVLVLFGCGAAMASGADITTTSLAFGISVLVMAYAVGHISGGHFNPAVSVGAAVAGRIAWVEVVFYVAAQLVGALLAGLALFITYKGFDGFEAEGNMAQNGFGDDGSGLALWAALLIEVIGTAVFLWVILAATDKRNKTILGAAPLAIGATLAGLHMVMIPLTGTSVNPARSIGVGVFAGTDAIVQLWVFIVAPLLGAALAGITYAFIFGNDGMAVPGSGFASGASAPAGGWAPGQGQWAPGPQGQQWAPQQPHQVNPNPGAPGGPGGAPSTPGGPQPGQWGQQPPAPQPGSPQPGQQPPGQWAPPAGGPGQQPGQWGPPPQPPNG